MRIISIILIVLIFGWLTNLENFMHRIPITASVNDESTDAIIVLTGGALRVERGFTLFGRDKAHTLFISGVGKDTTLKDLLAKYGNPEVREKVANGSAHIVLDYRSADTQTNAQEAAHFIREHGFSSVRLVTASYHMPRSLIEFQSVVPDVHIIPDPVFPESFQRDGWWEDTSSRDLVMSEFHKYMAVWIRTRLNLEAA